MNSSQRRKATRAHPHEVTLRACAGESWFKHDVLVMEAKKWCNKKAKGWIADPRWDHTVFKFSREQDAVLFALRWS